MLLLQPEYRWYWALDNESWELNWGLLDLPQVLLAALPSLHICIPPSFIFTVNQWTASFTVFDLGIQSFIMKKDNSWRSLFWFCISYFCPNVTRNGKKKTLKEKVFFWLFFSEGLLVGSQTRAKHYSRSLWTRKFFTFYNLGRLEKELDMRFSLLNDPLPLPRPIP